MNILTINLLLSTLVFWVAARLYIIPKLDEWAQETVLLPTVSVFGGARAAATTRPLAGVELVPLDVRDEAEPRP